MKKILLTFLFLFSLNINAKDVFFVSSYHKEVESIREIFETLVSSYDFKDKKHIYYLDSKRKSEDIVKRNSDQVFSDIKKLKPKLVFLCDDNALRFLGNRTIELGIQVIFLGINENPRKYISNKNVFKVYGVLEKPLIFRGIREINGLIKNKKNSIVIFDNSVTSNAIIRKLFPARSQIKSSDHIITYKVINSFDHFKKFISSVNLKNTHLFLGPVHRVRDKDDGKYLNYRIFLSKLSSIYKSEYYSFWKDYVYKDGAILSYGVDMKDQAITAVKIANEVLKGNYTGPRFIIPARGKSFVSKTQLKSRNLKLKREIRLSEIEYIKN